MAKHRTLNSHSCQLIKGMKVASRRRLKIPTSICKFPYYSHSMVLTIMLNETENAELPFVFGKIVHDRVSGGGIYMQCRLVCPLASGTDFVTPAKLPDPLFFPPGFGILAAGFRYFAQVGGVFCVRAGILVPTPRVGYFLDPKLVMISLKFRTFLAKYKFLKKLHLYSSIQQLHCTLNS